MNIFLTGVETNNKGAELMLYAILKEIEKTYPSSTVYIEKNRVLQGVKYVQTTLDFRLIDSNQFNSIFESFKINYFLRKIHSKAIVLPPRLPKIDLLIDGAGFLFSDSMLNLNEIVYWERLLKQLNKKKAKIVFLPQAFGPIEKKNTKKVIGYISKYSDLVFPREQISFDYLEECKCMDMNKVKVFPDFTSLVNGIVPRQYEHLSGGICIIPNSQMFKKGILSKECYLDYLAKLIKETQKSNHIVYLLNHQGEEDALLINDCKKTFGNQIEVVNNLNALETKGVISTAYLVISSRFHGVASALNSSVPCLATSWSHKYQALFQDYNQKDCIMSLDDIDSDIEKINQFLEKDNNDKIREGLSKTVPVLQQKTKEMWKIIWSICNTINTSER